MAASRGETTVEVRDTPEGRRLVVSRVVDAPVDIVWDVLTDTERWPAWGPSITDVECLDRYVQSGSRGRVRVLGAVWLPFEIMACEDRRWTWRVAHIRATGHFVSAHPAGSVVGFELPVAAVGYVPVCRRACGRIDRLSRALADSGD